MSDTRSAWTEPGRPGRSLLLVGLLAILPYLEAQTIVDRVAAMADSNPETAKLIVGVTHMLEGSRP